jgi:hypothetical protein
VRRSSRASVPRLPGARSATARVPPGPFTMRGIEARGRSPGPGGAVLPTRLSQWAGRPAQ